MNNLPLSPSYLNYLRPTTDFAVAEDRGVCDACGGYGPYIYRPIITDTLAKEWKLTPKEQKAFSQRESMFCVFCGCSYRLRALSRAIKAYTNPSEINHSLEDILTSSALQKYRIAEINSCGVLHDILSLHRRLDYSEYKPMDTSVRHEDLTQLSYKDNTYDMVLTSDTLEHVPDIVAALKEIHRVLKPDGAHIFTIPFRMDKKTVQRAMVDDAKKVIYIKPASYHGSGEPDYLVWHEFGWDVVSMLEDIGFGVQLYFLNPLNLQDPSAVFVTTKHGATASKELFIEDSSQRQVSSKVANDYTVGRPIKLINKPAIEPAKQTDKVKQLYQKLSLTEQHAVNLQDIIRDYESRIGNLNDHISKQDKLIAELQHQIQEFLLSIPGKVYTRINKRNL